MHTNRAENKCRLSLRERTPETHFRGAKGDYKKPLDTTSIATLNRYATKGSLRRELDSIQRTAGRTGSDNSHAWLSDSEQRAFATLADATRRDDWLLGRWLAKRILLETLSTNNTVLPSAIHPSSQLRRIEILPQSIGGLAARPMLVVDGSISEETISISHNDHGVMVAISEDPQVGVGVNLVSGDDSGDGFLRLWFTDQEQQWLRSRREFASRFWGAKEATYKSLNQGERFHPRRLEVTQSNDNRWQCRDRTTNRVAAIEFNQVGLNTWAVLSTCLRAQSQSNLVSSSL